MYESWGPREKRNLMIKFDQVAETVGEFQESILEMTSESLEVFFFFFITQA